VQAPAEHDPVAWWHWEGGLLHTMPAQGSFLQRPVAASQPEAQGRSTCWKEQAPVAGAHVPPENDREALPTQVGGGGEQTLAEPAHVPAPLH
jgi:hypothetical protein